MDNIIQHIEQVFNEKKLVGNHDFSEDEYSLMLDYVGKLYGNFDIKSYKVIFATLVEIAKRWKQSDNSENEEENSGYWEYVFKTLFGSEIDQQLCNNYRRVISWLGRYSNVPIVTGGQSYYATVMMHSFAPKSSIYSFFDLCFNIYKKDLDYGFTRDDEYICDLAASEIANILGHGYREDRIVSIGSSAYSIKIGLRSFALNNDLSTDFIQLIKDTFYQINKLFNNEYFSQHTRLERYIVDWWKNKTELDEFTDKAYRKKRISTVSKQNIVAKYIRLDNEVFLCIPSIRLDNQTNRLQLRVSVGGSVMFSEEMRTKRGELVVATREMEFELNHLLKNNDTIAVRIKIMENESILFDSEKSKATSLKREFILFEGEKEVLSQINKPTNYFVYSKNIDALKITPAELTTYGTNIYNIYPQAGESLIGEIRQVFFVNKDTVSKLGENVCLIGNLPDTEWSLDDISCSVYVNNVKLMVPEKLKLKALELRIDRKSYKLKDLKYEALVNNSYQYGLNSLGLISEMDPTEISLYSYEKEENLLSEKIILFSRLEIQYNKSFFYGDVKREVVITTENEVMKLSWNNQENEIKCPINDGLLLIKIPYLRWRIEGGDWHNEPINRKLWYKELLTNGDLLVVDNPKEDEEIKIFGIIDGNPIEIIKNQSGKFEIGRAIYASEGKLEIPVYCSNELEKFEFFNVATKEHFIDNPIKFRNGKIYWEAENTFLGEKNNDFFLIVKGEGDNGIRKQIGVKNIELTDLGEDLYKIIVKIKDQNIFTKKEAYLPIFQDKLIVGKPEKFRFKNKIVLLKKAKCRPSDRTHNIWIDFKPHYFIDSLKFVQEDDDVYYSGRLCVIDKGGNTVALNKMENEIKDYDETNPVRIELRDNNTLWLVAGWQGGNDFLGTLFCDLNRNGICNIAKENKFYSEINLYKFEEEENV